VSGRRRCFGTLNIALVKWVCSDVGNTFQILSCNVLAGTFDSIAGPDFALFGVQYNQTSKPSQPEADLEVDESVRRTLLSSSCPRPVPECVFYARDSRRPTTKKAFDPQGELPILHNPEKHKGGLLLTSRELAIKAAMRAGAFPRKSAASKMIEVWRRRASYMPPKAQLTAAEIDLLKKWIGQRRELANPGCHAAPTTRPSCFERCRPVSSLSWHRTLAGWKKARHRPLGDRIAFTMSAKKKCR